MSERILSSSEARDAFSDAVNRAAFAGERTIVVRRGRRVAVIAPVDDPQLEEPTAPANDEAHTDVKGAA